MLSTGITAAWAYEPAASGPVVTVYKTPSCGCCRKWVDHLRSHGFRVTSHDMADVQPIKRRHGVPGSAASCHTALVGGYVVEGHVPADVIQKLLRERPRVAGVAVPGMPMGSPGMEGPYSERYDVVSFDRSGKTAVYVRR
ncbi:MAG TPA: DUF411 domain-containing protein [Longimicrobiaceae bacterium]|nr:DUF411 domain-containing protein [Longimicrobiaceae bacterium]